MECPDSPPVVRDLQNPRFVILAVWWAFTIAPRLNAAGDGAGPDFSLSRLPNRSAGARPGSVIAQEVSGLSLPDREEILVREVLSGNVPDFLRHFVSIPFRDGNNTAGIAVAPDYLAVGTDADAFQIPLTPDTAQSLADRLDCVLPTAKMVDLIYEAAAVKLTPAPLPPSPEMTTVAVFLRHQDEVRNQRAGFPELFPLGALVGGNQKDVVITPHTFAPSEKVSIYGWHRLDGSPIQPLYSGHAANWVDYSHGIRLVRRVMALNGKPAIIDDVLRDPALAKMLNSEGIINEARYAASDNALFSGRTSEISLAPDIRAVVNRPAHPDPAKPVSLVIYAAPNGNSVEQTLGRQLPPGSDGHFGIQHAAAQMRWVRHHRPDRSWVLACVATAGKSWPAWTRQHPDAPQQIRGFVDRLRREAGGLDIQIILTGHSGGGAFTFGFLDSAETISDDVSQISFLDSNYGYDSSKNHNTKFVEWLQTDTNHRLTVIAYHDSNALLDGKPFVSEKGGTWGRSHAMLTDLRRMFSFDETVSGNLHHHTGLDGRARFLLMENPDRAILHTLLVERNGLIHSLLPDLRPEDKICPFFGKPVYREFIGGVPRDGDQASPQAVEEQPSGQSN